MNSFKPLILLVVLGGVAFGVYRSLTRGPAELPPGVDPSATEPVDLQLPDLADSRSSKTPDVPKVLSPAGDALQHKPLAITPSDASRTAAPPFQSTPPVNDNAKTSPNPFNNLSDRSSFAAPTPLTTEPPRPSPQIDKPQPHPDSASPFAVALVQVQKRLASGQLPDGLKELSAWHGNPQLSAAEQLQLQQLLSNLAGTVIYSREHHLSQPYTVQPGERLEDIANKHKVTAELLAKINGISETAPIVPGEEVKILKGPFSAVIDIQKRQFTLLLDGCYAGSFPLADIGPSVAAGGQPVQDLTVTQKTVGPIYNGSAGEVPANDPHNPLGKHLLALGNEFALHGTPAAPSQQPSMPEGGIRLAERDIVDVFDILTVGSRVVIRR